LDGDGYYSINRSGHSMVAWAWDAGSSNTTIAAGSLNSSLYDQSQTWSNYVTGTAYSGYPITNAFNGDTSTRSLESGSTGHTFTPPSAITVNSSLRVYLQYANSSATNALKVNGTDKSNLITTTGSNLGWLTIPGITSITSLFWGVSPSGIETCSISAIEVDGKILVDSGVSVTNVPSIASTVRANPSAGFSIVTHSQGASNSTVGHGLGATPKMIISRPRNQTSSWLVYHYDLGKDKILRLNTADASSTVSNLWGTAEPTSSVFGVGAAGSNSNNWGDVISYCFAPVEGYSAMGSYVGNGSNDGSFVFTGFAVKWLLTKASSAGSDWQIWDVSRQPYNVNANTLTPNSSAAESGTAGYAVDLLSNGFKFRLYGSSANASGVTYAWAAFAEHPFKTSRAR
jgi:hypothetical protein